MTEPAVEILPDAAGVAATVATRLLERLALAQAAGRLPHVVLTGGTIADELHREVARLAPDAGVDWGQVAVWWGDERFVEPDSPDRNAGQARAAMLDRLPLPPEQVHEMPSTAAAADVEEAAAVYAAELEAHGPDEFEIVMLGIGPDGHIASLFPGFPQVDDETHTVVGVTGSPKPPPERVSLTRPVLARTASLWFLASGGGKAPAVATALAQSGPHPRGGASSTEAAGLVHRAGSSGGLALPAARVRGRAETVWFVDEAAASELRV